MKSIILLDNRTSHSIKRYTIILSKVSNGEIVRFGSSSFLMTMIKKYLLIPIKLWFRKPMTITLPSEGYSYLLPFLKKHKTIVVCHDLHDLMNVNVANWRKCLIKFQLKKLKYANHLIAISEHTKYDFIKLFDEKFTSKMIVIHNPIEDFWFNSVKYIPEKFQNTNLENFVLLIGSIAWYKNLDRAFEAIENISGITIVRVGAVKPQWIKLAGTERLYIYDNLTDHELQWLYQNAKLLFFPSIHEGFGWPLLEAMASKCPIVTSKKASIPEICENSVFYTDPYNIKLMSESIQKILENKVELKSKTDKGFLLASRYKIHSYSNKMLNIIYN